MVSRKNTLKSDPFDDIQVIGITTTLQDYKLAWFINQNLHLDLKKHDDIVPEQLEEEARYSFYLFDQGENMNVFNLVSINDGGLRWLKLPVTTDYLLIIRNPIDEERLQDALRSIRNISQVILAFLIEQSKIKGIDPLLEQIELHEFEMLKETNKRYPRK